MTSIKHLLSERYQTKKLFYSIEITPKQDHLNVDYTQLPITPLFTSITWMGDDNLRYEELKDSPALKMTKNLTEQEMPVLNHLSCYNLKEKHLDEILDSCINIFPLKGDSSSSEHSDAVYGSSNELLAEIRKKKGDVVTIFTSAYPKTFENMNDKIQYFHALKEKVSIGADAIITQLVFDSNLLSDFILDCKHFSIDIPILPGIYLPSSYNALKRMEALTGSKIPPDIIQKYELLKDDSKKFIDFAVESTVQLIKEILDKVGESVNGFHFFTLNNLNLLVRVLKHFDFQ